MLHYNRGRDFRPVPCGTSYNGISITYDAIGNPLKWRNAQALEWNGRQLTLFGASNGEVYTYTYNADGIRTSKLICNADGGLTGTTEYIYDGTKLIAESRSGDWLYYFYDASGAVTGMSYGGTLYYYRKNLQGDITGIYNATGTLVVEYEYTPYGAILSTTGSMATTIGAINPIRYRGYYYDIETELYYLITRYYDPEVGRFLNADVYVSTGKGVVSNNMFAYCLNDPINMIDIDGCDPIPQWAIRIIQGDGTEEDYVKALSVDPNAWVGYARYSVDEAIEIAENSYVALYETHHKRGTTNPAKKPKHDKGESRRKRDNRGEKGDARRKPNPNKRKKPAKSTAVVIEPSTAPSTAPSTTTSSFGETFFTIAKVAGATIGIIYVIGNDFTGVGAADDGTLVPLFGIICSAF